MTDWHDTGAEGGMYLDNIIEHYREPQAFGELAGATFGHEEISLSCGDAMTVRVRLDADRRVADAKFTGQGCALSVAGASMLLPTLKGKGLEELAALGPDEMRRLFGFEVGYARQNCALLALKTLQRGLHEYLRESA
jgi:nitrogen fixation NifU-like protein